MRIKKHIPNAITCLNVLSGSLSVLLAIYGMLTEAVILMVLAAIFDFLDGMVARLLKAYSPMGKELDSLADVISFGLAPGMVMFTLQQKASVGSILSPDQLLNLSPQQLLFILSAFLIPIFSALRLAKFNIDTRQSDSFIGLPTPANALLIGSLALIAEHGQYPALDSILLHPIFLLILTITTSGLLVSELPMFALKFKNLSWEDNKIRFLFLLLSLVLIVAFTIYGITGSILSFILISVITTIKGAK